MLIFITSAKSSKRMAVTLLKLACGGAKFQTNSIELIFPVKLVSMDITVTIEIQICIKSADFLLAYLTRLKFGNSLYTAVLLVLFRRIDTVFEIRCHGQSVRNSF